MLSCYWNIATTRLSRAQGEFAWRIARVWIWRAGNASHVSRGKRARGVQCAASAANHSSPSARVFESVRVIDRARETIVVREKPRRREQVARERERERERQAATTEGGRERKRKGVKRVRESGAPVKSVRVRVSRMQERRYKYRRSRYWFHPFPAGKEEGERIGRNSTRSTDAA